MEQFGVLLWRRVCGSTLPQLELKSVRRRMIWSSRFDFETRIVLNLFVDQDRLSTVDQADLNDLSFAEEFLVKASRYSCVEPPTS